MGAKRDDRSLWAWIGPIATVAMTFAFLIAFGVLTHIDLGLTIPMAVVMSLFLGTLSAFYLTAASADEHDADDDDGPRHATAPPDGGSGADALREEAERQRVAVLDRHVARVEELEVHVVHPERRQRVAERDGAEVEEELVPLAGVDPHRAE